MLGANTVMLEILDSNRVDLGVTAQGFDQAIKRNRAFLKTERRLGLFHQRLILLTAHRLPLTPRVYPSCGEG
jgi:hypothetical protein